MLNDKFDATLQLIKDKKRKSLFYEKEIRSYFENELKEDFDQFAKRMVQYYDEYYRYLELLGKYEHAEKITPLDVFPGIRTVKNTTDVQGLEADSIEMEKLARSIKEIESSLEKREGDLITNMKRSSQALASLLQTHGEIQESFRQMMEEMDSVYDIGFLSRNT